MLDIDEGALNGFDDAYEQITNPSEPPAEEQTETTEEQPGEQPAAEEQEQLTGVDAPVEEQEPVNKATIPYERFREVNEAKIRAEEAARIYQEQLQAINQPVYEQEEEEDPYDIPDDELALESVAVQRMALARRQERADMQQLRQSLQTIEQERQQNALLAQAQAEFNETVSLIEELTDKPITDKEALMQKASEIQQANIRTTGKPLTVKDATQRAYKELKTVLQPTPPKPAVTPKIEAVKQSVNPVGGGSIPTGAQPVIAGTMNIGDAFEAAFNSVKP